ncbi:acyl carrier protein [Henriciella sp.]|uniref:acyl carrier protein n=1 Tax=Henriciella sp. TaxID=1968823 RepID=UPI0026341FE8|nr:acyl carrier protein [Henriciella sp.]
MIEKQVKATVESGADVAARQASEKIGLFILERFPAFAETSFDEATPLLDEGLIDSLGMIELVSFLEETFDIEMEDEDFLPENLETLRSLSKLVISKQSR